jgi:hypothetical protein
MICDEMEDIFLVQRTKREKGKVDIKQFKLQHNLTPPIQTIRQAEYNEIIEWFEDSSTEYIGDNFSMDQFEDRTEVIFEGKKHIEYYNDDKLVKVEFFHCNHMLVPLARMFNHVVIKYNDHCLMVEQEYYIGDQLLARIEQNKCYVSDGNIYEFGEQGWNQVIE